MRKTLLALVVVANIGAAAASYAWVTAPNGHASTPRPTPKDEWAAIGPQARCDTAELLVSIPNLWPTVCRWRDANETVQGLSFPPPVGEPPWDHPHIEVYVGRDDTRVAIAHAIAHEMGHMRHTRTALFGPVWLQARALPSDTPATIWTEDYAEVFAALFGPPVEGWRAPTARPTPDVLSRLQSQFFGPQ